METAAKPRLALPNDRNKAHRPGDAEPLFVVSPDRILPQHSVSQSGARQVAENAYFLSFLQSIESRIRQLRSIRSLDRRACAEEILSIIRELVRFECEATSFEAALPHLVSELWAESHIRELLKALHDDARQMLHPRVPLAVEQGYECATQIALLDYFVDWFSRRRAVLASYADHPLCDAGDVLISSIVHDQVRLGERGCELLVSLRVDGLEFQTLWLRAALFCDEAPVAFRKGWHFWGNDHELFTFFSLSEGQAAPGSFTSVVPVVPVDQRAIYDQVKLFIPYAALALPAQSRQQIDFEVSLLTSAGRMLSSDACSENVALPELIPSYPIPSPAALGFWDHNVGRGDSVTIRKISLVRHFEARHESCSLEIDYDLCCINRRQESLAVEVRVLSIDGNLIESSLEGFSAKDGTFLGRRTLIPEGIVSLHPASRFSVPLIALELDRGTHDLLVEVTLIGSDNRVICGMVDRFHLNMPDITPGSERELYVSAAQQALDSALFFSGVRIDPTCRFNTRDNLRIEAAFFDGDPREESCQLRVVVEGEGAGDLPKRSIMRALRMDRNRERSEHSQIFVFDSEEILSLFPTRKISEPLRVTLEVLNQQRVVILSTQRECRLPEHFGRERNAHTVSASGAGEVEIVEAVMRSTPLRGGESLLELVLNVDPQRSERGTWLLYCEPIIPGRTVTGATNPEGSMAELSFPALKISYESLAVVQERRIVRLPVAQAAYGAQGVKLMLFSPAGRLIQVVYQRSVRAPESSSLPASPAAR